MAAGLSRRSIKPLGVLYKNSMKKTIDSASNRSSDIVQTAINAGFSGRFHLDLLLSVGC
jgi:hypothetical protein